MKDKILDPLFCGVCKNIIDDSLHNIRALYFPRMLPGKENNTFPLIPFTSFVPFNFIPFACAPLAPGLDADGLEGHTWGGEADLEELGWQGGHGGGGLGCAGVGP